MSPGARALLRLACLCLGATLHATPAAYAPHPELQRKMRAYQRHHVRSVSGLSARINGEKVRVLEVQDYYADSGAVEAYSLTQQALEHHRAGHRAVAFGALGTGLLGGACFAAAFPKDSSLGASYGVILGAGLGTLGGLVLKYTLHRPRANRKFSLAARSFNAHLLDQLDWHAAPSSQGVKAGLKLRF